MWAGSFCILKQPHLTEDFSICECHSRLQSQLYQLAIKFSHGHRKRIAPSLFFIKTCENSPVKYLSYSYDLGTCECPFDNINKDSKCILKLITEYRAIKSVIKIYSDNYYGQNTHLYPNLHVNFFLNFKSSWFLSDKHVDPVLITRQKNTNHWAFIVKQVSITLHVCQRQFAIRYAFSKLRTIKVDI